MEDPGDGNALSKPDAVIVEKGIFVLAKSVKKQDRENEPKREEKETRDGKCTGQIHKRRRDGRHPEADAVHKSNARAEKTGKRGVLKYKALEIMKIETHKSVYNASIRCSISIWGKPCFPYLPSSSRAFSWLSVLSASGIPN